MRITLKKWNLQKTSVVPPCFLFSHFFTQETFLFSFAFDDGENGFGVKRERKKDDEEKRKLWQLGVKAAANSSSKNIFLLHKFTNKGEVVGGGGGGWLRALPGPVKPERQKGSLCCYYVSLNLARFCRFFWCFYFYSSLPVPSCFYLSPYPNCPYCLQIWVDRDRGNSSELRGIDIFFLFFLPSFLSEWNTFWQMPLFLSWCLPKNFFSSFLFLI